MKKEYPPVLDACCGGRAMWFDRADSRALYIDRRNETVMFHASTGNLPHTIAPDQVCDFTNMPFPNDTFSLVVFDPPHVQRDQPLGNITKRYGCLNGDWRGMLRDGFSECFRVLKPSGILIFKWSSVQFALKEILELTPEKPLFGHQSGKRMNTHWVCFMKDEDARAENQGSRPNFVQQLKAEIADLVLDVEASFDGVKPMNFKLFLERLRQLSAV